MILVVTRTLCPLALILLVISGCRLLPGSSLEHGSSSSEVVGKPPGVSAAGAPGTAGREAPHSVRRDDTTELLETAPIPVPQPLTQDDAVRIALARSPNLLAGTARIRAAEARISQARAGYLPAVDLNAEATRHLKTPGVFRWPGLDSRYESYAAALSASWLIFDGFAREAQYVTSLSGQIEAVAAYHDMQRLLTQAVNIAFNNALLAREEITIAEADASFNDQLLTETRLKLEAGSAARSEVLNFEIRLNSAKSQLISARSQLQVAKAVLVELMGLPEQVALEELVLAPLDVQGEERVEIPDEPHLLRHAVLNRPDLEMLRQVVERASLDEAQSRSAFYPSLFLLGSYGAQRIDNPRFSEDDVSAQASLNLAWNLFNGSADTAAVRTAKAVTDQRRRELSAQLLVVLSEVRQALAQLTNAREQLRLQTTSYHLTSEARDLVLKEYQAGQASLVRLNEAQRDLVEAQGHLSLSKIQLRGAWINLRTATALDRDHWRSP